ncbi:hypothetical protein ACFL35_09680 [Candidatus Riflebacteria bacterium]
MRYLIIMFLAFTTMIQAGEVTFNWGTAKGEIGYYNHNVKNYADEENPMGPLSFDFDAEGNIYISDTFNKRIQKFSNTGKFLDSFGGEHPAFAFPGDLKVFQGSLFFIDSLRQKIIKCSLKGELLGEFGGLAKGKGKIIQAHILEIGQDGTFFIGDRGKNRILIFSRRGKFRGSFQWNLNGFHVSHSGEIIFLDYRENKGYFVRKRGFPHTQGNERLISVGQSNGINAFVVGQDANSQITLSFGDAKSSKVRFLTIDSTGKIRPGISVPYCNDIRWARVTRKGELAAMKYNPHTAPKGKVRIIFR